MPMTADDVFFLWHICRTRSGHETEMPIGIYTTRGRAQAAIRRLRRQPGFWRRPDKFFIFKYRLDRDAWPESFVTDPGRKRAAGAMTAALPAPLRRQMFRTMPVLALAGRRSR